jgi:hypothetical protein
MITAPTIDQYISAFPAPIQKILIVKYRLENIFSA